MHFNVRKAIRPEPRRYIYSNVKKQREPTEEQREILARINAFLDEHVPGLAALLYRMHNNQQKAVTYKELRELVMRGYISRAKLDEWRADYSRFVTNTLEPMWESAMRSGAGTRLFNQEADHVRAWVMENGARGVTNETEETRAAVQAIRDHARATSMSVDETARAIRPVIGLTRQAAASNVRFYTHTRDRLIREHPRTPTAKLEERASEVAARHAERLHRQRAQTIANTELAFAWNRGTYESVRQAMAEGALPGMKKCWTAARDHKVCEICERLDGVTVGFDDDFDIPGGELFTGMHATPPAHPRCRCAVQYIEAASGEPERGNWAESLSPEERERHEIDRKMYRNREADKEQHRKYRAIFGDDIPKKLDEFQDLKYNNVKAWNEFKSGKQARLNVMEFKDMGSLIGRLGNQEVRLWYKAQNGAIPGKLDTSKSWREQAKQAFAMRNRNKASARKLMKDRKIVQQLTEKEDKKRPLSFEDMVKHKEVKYDLHGDAAYKDIIRSCATTNADFDRKAGVKWGDGK